jgi:hypothetical protein
MRTSCPRLSLMEREELSRMLAAGYSLRATAQVLHRAPSTLSRELIRHRPAPSRIGRWRLTNEPSGGLIVRGNPETWRSLLGRAAPC